MKRIVILTTVALALSGCAQSSGVNKLGPDTYTVSIHAAPVRGGESGAKGLAFAEATRQCSEMGKEILVEKMVTRPSNHFPGGTAELIFHCFDKNDPRLGTPSYVGREPDIIESK